MFLPRLLRGATPRGGGRKAGWSGAVRSVGRVSGRRGALLAGLALAAACTAPARPGGPEPPGEACAVGPAWDHASGLPEDSSGRPVVVGLLGPVDTERAPVPVTPGERLLFAQLYETLVRVDCGGRAVPGLAASWDVDEDGSRWTFTIRPGAVDWDGRAVTAASVASSWIRSREAASGPAEGALPFPALGTLTVLGPASLRVDLPRPVTVDFFARPELAVENGPGAGGWPSGTGVLRPSPGALRASAFPSIIPLAGSADLELRSVPDDARDALDGGVDVLVSMDPVTIEYARAAPHLRTAPFAWDRTYLLLAAGPPAAGAAAGAGEGPPPSALAALARDAVPLEARPAPAPPSAEACPAAGAGEGAGARPAPRGDAPRRTVAYPAGDAVARGLAERLVALSLDRGRADARWLAESVPGLADGPGTPAAVGLPPEAFAAALASGSEAAFVFPVGVTAGADPCETLAAAAARAPWLRPGPSGAPGAWRGVVLPLVQTRSTLVVREGVGGLVVDGSGVPRLEGVVRRGPEGGR